MVISSLFNTNSWWSYHFLILILNKYIQLKWSIICSYSQSFQSMQSPLEGRSHKSYTKQHCTISADCIIFLFWEFCSFSWGMTHFSWVLGWHWCLQLLWLGIKRKLIKSCNPNSKCKHKCSDCSLYSICWYEHF